MINFLITVCGAFFAGWMLQNYDLDRGRWQSCTMFLPGIVILMRAASLGKARGGVSLIWGSMLMIFGVTILIIG